VGESFLFFGCGAIPYEQSQVLPQSLIMWRYIEQPKMLQDVLFNGEVPAKVPQHDEKKERHNF
jgi:hypothetical protein